MINAIPNPKKSLTIDFSLGNTKKGIERISLQETVVKYEKKSGAIKPIPKK
jgi:hypothetical protein